MALFLTCETPHFELIFANVRVQIRYLHVDIVILVPFVEKNPSEFFGFSAPKYKGLFLDSLFLFHSSMSTLRLGPPCLD